MPAPTIEQVRTDFEDSTVTTYTADMPTSIVSGELLLAFVMHRSSSPQTINTPSGWTLVTNNSVQNVGARVFSKVAGASEASTQDFVAASGTHRWCSAILRISGHDGVDVSGSSTQGTGTSTTHTAPSVTTTVADTRVIRAVMQDLGNANSGSPYTSPGTEIWDFTSGNNFGTSSAGGHASQASAGASGTANFTSSKNFESVTFTVAVKPAAGGGSLLIARRNRAILAI